MEYLDATKLTNADLIARALAARPHVHTWDASDWEEREGIPMLRELALRLAAADAAEGNFYEMG